MDGETAMSIWEKSNYIATWVIAIVAVAGFTYSIWASSQATKTSEHVTKTLQGIESSLAAQLVPTIGFSDFNWIALKGDESGLPIGIVLEIMNTSSVPIQLGEGGAKYYFGDDELPESEHIYDPSGETILYPGKDTQYRTQNKKAFQGFLKDTQISAPPFLRVEFEAIFRRLNHEIKYKYRTIVLIGFDRHTPDTKSYQRYVETIEPITDN